MKKFSRFNFSPTIYLLVSVGFAFFSYILIQVVYSVENQKYINSNLLDLQDQIRQTFQIHFLSLLLWIGIIITISLLSRAAVTRYIKNENRLRSILNTAVDGIITIDEHGIIEDVNPAMERLFGYSPLELVGRNINMLMPEYYYSRHDKYIQNYIKTGVAKIIGIGRESVGRRKDGSEFPIDLAVSEMRIENQRKFIGLVKDIAVRKEIENELEKQLKWKVSLAEFNLAVDQSHEIRNMLERTMQVASIALPASAGACIALWNDKKNDISVCSSTFMEEHEQRALQQFVHSTLDVHRIISGCKPVIKSKISKPDQLLVGSFIKSYLGVPLCVENKVLGVLFAFERKSRRYCQDDIEFLQSLANRAAISINRVNLHDDLQSSNALLAVQQGEMRALLDSTSEAIGLVSPEREFIALNKNFYEWFGIEPPVVGSLRFTSFIEQANLIFEKPGLFLSTISKSINDLTGQFEKMFIQVWPERRELKIFSTPVRTDDGHHLGRLFVFHDVTREQEASHAKSEFVSTVSHELRTPLTSIYGSLGLMNGGAAGELSEQAKTLVNIAYQNSERLIRLINDILDIEKIESGRMVFMNKPTLLNTVLTHSIEFTHTYAEQYGISFNLDNSYPQAMVYVDSDKLVQVMVNLLSNAAKYTTRNDIVEISVSRQKQKMRVAVTDHGPGISRQFRQHIFQKFAQADMSNTKKKGGTGLGLSISKTIIEKMGGEIGYHSRINHGSTFYFLLPEWQPANDEEGN